MTSLQSSAGLENWVEDREVEEPCDPWKEVERKQKAEGHYYFFLEKI